MENLSLCPIPYFCDRTDESTCVEIAENMIRNRIYLWGDVWLEPSESNIFDTSFEMDAIVNREYLLAMDYLSSLLSAYKKTGNDIYKQKFFEIILQFFDYYDRGKFIPALEDDLIVCAQILMFIKSFSLISYEYPLKDKIQKLMYDYAMYCYDDKNHYDDNNHGLFTDMGLLHLSICFGNLPDAKNWQNHAIKRVEKLFETAFYQDGFNNEGSLHYFFYNLNQYQKILKFCEVYHVKGLEGIYQKIAMSEKVLLSFAHRDGSYPVIGDGDEFFLKPGNYTAAIYSHAGICVAKIKDMYLTLKGKAVMQSHTHVDDTSITARFQVFDLALDSGQYNYDRYHPINRYLRTSGGHSGIFPLFVDGLSLKEYLDRRNDAAVEQFHCDGNVCRILGRYELDDGDIKVWRKITMTANRIEVCDCWECTHPQNMRQRFILPQEFLEKSRFTASKRLFETSMETFDIKYEVTSKVPITTTVNFGVYSKEYVKFESTILLDTIAENSLCGEITAIITVNGKGE